MKINPEKKKSSRKHISIYYKIKTTTQLSKRTVNDVKDVYTRTVSSLQRHFHHK